MGLPSFILPIMGKSLYDSDAQAFITAAGITNATQKSAITTLVLALKSASIWTKFNAIYPMVGGTATTHKYNLKNPLDTDAAFRLSFVGGWTHSSTGALPNGTNGYADSFLIPSTTLSLNSSHLSYYSRTNVNLARVEIGVENFPVYNLLQIRTSGVTYPLINQSAITSFADANSLGFYLGNRQGVNDVDGWKNGVKLVNGTQLSQILPINKIYIGALNVSGTASLFSTKECAFATIGSGLSDTEASTLYTLIQAFQTSLSRNV
jgi:hypothetical protein